MEQAPKSIEQIKSEKEAQIAELNSKIDSNWRMLFDLTLNKDDAEKLRDDAQKTPIYEKGSEMLEKSRRLRAEIEQDTDERYRLEDEVNSLNQNLS